MEQSLSARSAAVYPSVMSQNPSNSEANSSGVSWSAVIAGGFVTAALSLILLALGTGLGLSSVSFWSDVGASASSVGTAAIGWLILMEIMSSSMGGYLAGRLRTKWTSIHSDEVYFRDTAHGFLAWCLSLVVSAAFLASAATSMVGSTFSSGEGHSGTNASVAAGTHEGGPNAYFVDSLFRTTSAKPEGGTAARAHNEAEIILAHALEQHNLAPADKTYVAQLIAETTGLSQADSNQRVDDVFGDATHAAETARKSIAHTLLWTFLALLIGAFCASLSATIGGKQRDHVVII
jgi:hypothetical protein